MNVEGNLKCPACGAPVSAEDKTCKSCGASLASVSEAAKEVFPAEGEVRPVYERKFSLPKRFWKLLVSPSEAMRDIALAPEYGGVFVNIAFEVVVAVLAIWLVFSKIAFVGANASLIGGIVSITLSVVMVLAVVMRVGMWLVKSLIVKYACDSSSEWDFKTAASVTGYAYLADVIIGVLGFFVAWFLYPSVTFDTSSASAINQAVANYKASVAWLYVCFTLPMSFLGLAWKSYLGALGTHFGTREKARVSGAFIVFFALGLIAVALSVVGLA